MTFNELIESLPEVPQAQYSMVDQLWKLALIARKIHLHAAFEYLYQVCKLRSTIEADPYVDNIIKAISPDDICCEEASNLPIMSQLSVLHDFAVKLRLYDADDFMKSVIK